MPKPKPPVPTLRRKRDWVDRLDEEINKRVETKFAWGTHDCVMATVRCIKAVTGKDVAQPFQEYKTLRGALRMLVKHKGFGGIAKSVAERHGWNEIEPMFAQRGDCVLVKSDVVDPETGLDEYLGIVDLSGNHILVADEVGWRELPLAAGIRAWRIG